MKKQNIVAVFVAVGLLFQSTSIVFAQYDTGTTYPTYDTGTTYPTYDMGTTYPTYDTGTTYPTYNTGTTYPTYNTGTTYPTYDMGTTYPTYDTGVSYPIYDTGVSYPTYTSTIPTIYGSTGYSYPTTYGYTSGYSYPTTIGNYGYMGGGYTTSCPSGSTLVNGTCQINNVICPSGTTLVGNSCVVNATSTCPTGSTLINGVCTISTVVTNYTCPNGTVVAYASLCPVNYTYPTYTTNYQTCWDGSVIPNTSICPSQYKTCADGTYIPVNQACYYGGSNYYNSGTVVRYPIVTPLPTVKFNNVVTSVVTEITNTSGRCNGIGLIANGAPSAGWFEYGETPSLGRTTASAQIGRSATAPFSNVLANLKPTTKYYCRAVMQNQYGTVKGEIVSFVTKSKVTTYVQPVVTSKKVVTKKVTTPIKKTEITCTDGTTVWVKNELLKTPSTNSAVSIVGKGEKLITLQVEKGEVKFTPNAPASYKIVYKNLSDSRLTGVVVKVVIPTEVEFNLATAGNYDETTHTLTLNQDTLDPYSEGIIAISGKIKEDAPIGKTIVATAYVSYTVPSTVVQDEVTAYVVGSIVPTDNIAKADTGAKKVIGSNSERGFMPNNLVEWLALIAIIFIIFILARSIYVSYKEDEEGGH